MSVEWLRSCYRSKWFLFRDLARPSIAGRYYFSPPGTPFYDGTHNLQSRNWQDKNWRAAQGLGEDLAAGQSWDDGGFPAVVPNLFSAGSSDCIAGGEVFAGGLPAGEMVNGFIPACFVAGPGPATTFEEASDFQSCSIQFAYARVIEWLYDANTVSLDNFFAGFLGGAWTRHYHAPTTLLPSVYTAVSPQGSLVWVDGTVNFQQFALQAAYSLIPPQDMGIFGTSLVWYAAATYIHSMLVSDGADAAKPVFFCGHSYGSVSALVLAARYRAANPAREIVFLGFGTPRIGDVRLVDILRGCRGYCFCNDNDIVAAIPPDLTVLFPVFIALGVPLLLVWPAWKPAPFQAMMDDVGEITFDGVPILDFVTLLAFAGDVLADIPYPQIVGHGITSYRGRIYARCSSAEWPLDADDYAKLLADDFILLEIGDPILLENNDPILLEF